MQRRTFAFFLSAVLALGIADSLSGPYLAVFAAEEAQMRPFQVGVLASATGLSGILISTWLGRRFDRRPSRVYILGACLAGALGYALLSVTRDFWLLLLLSLTLLGIVAVAFPQLFALARRALGDGNGGRRAAPALRSGWSLSWALGPFLGALLLARYGFEGVFLATAVMLLATAAVVALVPGHGLRPTDETDSTPTSSITVVPGFPLALLVLGVALFFTSMFAGSLVLSLFVTDELELPATSLGLLTSACAAVEVVVALGLAFRPPRTWLIPGGMLLMAGYFALSLLAQGMLLLLIAQAVRGAAIAVVGAAGIVYFQDVMAPATGRATTLFSNATTAGLLISGVLSGLWIETLGYRVSLGLCGVAAALGAAAFAWAVRRLSVPVGGAEALVLR